jgi:hypothetical protein
VACKLRIQSRHVRIARRRDESASPSPRAEIALRATSLAALAVAPVAVFTASCVCAQGDDAAAKRRPWHVVIVNEVEPLSATGAPFA